MMSSLTRRSIRWLHITALMNLGVVGVAIVTATPERQTALNVFGVAIVAGAISFAIVLLARIVARRGQFGGAIGMIVFLFTGYTIIPSVLLLVGKHDGTVILIATQGLYWLILLFTLIVTIKASSEPGRSGGS